MVFLPYPETHIFHIPLREGYTSEDFADIR